MDYNIFPVGIILKLNEMSRFLISAFLILSMFSCSSSGEKILSFSLKVKVNEEAGISNQVKILVTSVCDSRCPEGCECVWAGEANVFFKLNDQGNLLDTNLVLPSRPRMVYKNYSIELKSVNPYPICNYLVTDDYTIQFLVENLKK